MENYDNWKQQTPDEPADNFCDFCGEPCESRCRYCSNVCKKECERIED